MQFLLNVLDYNNNVVKFNNAPMNVNGNIIIEAGFFLENGGRVQSSNSLFSGLSEQDQIYILDQCTRRMAVRRSVIVRQGSEGRDMFIVLSGSLKVSVVSGSGKEISFVVLRKDDYFGELSMIDGRPRSATVSALEDSDLLVLGHSGYEHLLQQHPHTATKFLTYMLKTLSNRLRATDELYQDSVFLDVSARLAKFLLSASIKDNGPDPIQKRLDIRLSQYELGTLVNASRESVNKQLRNWENRGIVEIDNGKIILLNPDLLQKEAERL